MQSLEALGINLPSLLWHTVNFGLLLWLLSRFLYRPITKVLDQRAARIKESMDQTEAIKRQFALASEEARASIEKARREGQAIIDQASQIAEGLRTQGRQDAQAEADKIVAKARAQIDNERQQAVTELRREMADLVVSAAGKVIGQTLDDRAQRRLVEDFLRDGGQRLND